MDRSGEKPIVAFLGPVASYTHQAAISEFPDNKYEVRPQTGIEDVFVAVQTKQADYGVVPFENSSNGSVVQTLDLFADVRGDFQDLLVEGEIYVRVQHCLVGHAHAKRAEVEAMGSAPDFSKGNAKEKSAPVSAVSTPDDPTTTAPQKQSAHDLKHITKIYSHPQAWGQCNLFLNANLKGIERQDTSSTSKAAEIVAADPTKTTAAISSRIAATVFNLDILAENIEDKAGNSTRFFILRRQDSRSLYPVETHLSEEHEMGEYKSLVSFTVSHESAGAMADSLAVFKKHGLNLTNLASRPSGETPWHYIFFVEFMGRKRSEVEGGAVNRALGELDGVARSWRWYGSWANRLLER